MTLRMKQTALHGLHIQNGARMTEFAGWRMPLFFSGIREEHLAVRSACGVFDVSHMGEVEISGPGAETLCQRILTNDVSALGDGADGAGGAAKAQYSLLCNKAGGILDDLIVYRRGPELFTLCVNAANTERDFEWISSLSRGFDVEVRDASREYSLVAVQGPGSEKALRRALQTGEDGTLPPRFSFLRLADGGWVARTGYTGEDGFEVFLPTGETSGSGRAADLWRGLVSGGDVTMCGLGCRDTLRLEMGYPLYGNEINENVNPFEAGLGRYVKMDKGDFCGRDALGGILKSGARRTLCGIEMVEPGVPRGSYKVFCGGAEAGTVTSGTVSPSLGRPVGLAMIDAAALETARRDGVEILIRNRRRKAAVAGTPFYRRNTV